ncbi:MAG: sigma-70 family RNA polymerase sigma factor [Gemmatimonadota bacterium]
MKVTGDEPEPVDVEALYAEVHPGLYRYCHRLTGDPDAAADVAQEAFVRLVERDVQGAPHELRAWLFKVATHRIRDRFRTRENRRRLLEIHPVLPGAAPDPDDEVERAQRVGRVREVLERLNLRDRELLLMREEGFSYKEMADAVGVAPGSVGTLLARALARFADALRAEGIHATG